MNKNELKYLLDKENIPSELFDQIHVLQKAIVEHIPEENRKSLVHLTELRTAYSFVYYVALVNHYLQNENKEGLIVDWGGYVGQVTILLNALGYHCENYLLEPPREDLLNVFETYSLPMNYKVKKGPIETFSYQDNSCLAVISSGVLEHVREGENAVTEEQYLAEIERVLKPGGYFFCWYLPRKLSLLEGICRLRGTSHHTYTYYERTVKRWMNQHNLEIVYMSRHDDILQIFPFLRKKIYAKGVWEGRALDQKFSSLPGIDLMSHFMTLVCRKKQ